jgi:hypothetical protein
MSDEKEHIEKDNMLPVRFVEPIRGSHPARASVLSMTLALKLS